MNSNSNGQPDNSSVQNPSAQNLPPQIIRTISVKSPVKSIPSTGGQWLDTVEDLGYEIGPSDKKPTKWQEECYEALVNKPRGLINAPTGSGKSTIISYLACGKLNANPELKVIITVPQIIIAGGFKTNNKEISIILPDAVKDAQGNPEVTPWKIDESMCSEINMDSKTLHLENFLKQKLPASIDQRVIVCSQQSYTHFFNQLEELKEKDINNYNSKRQEINSNVLLIVDEAHHIHYESEQESNEFGKLVERHYSETKIPAYNNEMLLVTATFFRNGGEDILPSRVINCDFERFDLPFDRHFKTMKHLNSFCYDIVLYKSDFVENVVHAIHDLNESVSNDKKENRFATVVAYVPMSQTKTFRAQTEAFDLEKTEYEEAKANIVSVLIEEVKSLLSSYNPNEWGTLYHYEDPKGVIHLSEKDVNPDDDDVWVKEYPGENKEDVFVYNLKGASLDYKVLDLVNINFNNYNKKIDRESRKYYLQNTSRIKSCFNLVLAMGMVKEGMDVPHADGMVIVGAKGSQQEMIQMIGRLLRDSIDWRSKESVALIAPWVEKHGRKPIDRPVGIALEEDILPTEGFMGEADLVHKLKKTAVRVIHLLQFNSDVDKEELRANYNEYFKQLAMGMLMETALQPIVLIETLPDGTVVGVDYFKKLGINDSQQQHLLTKFMTFISNNNILGDSNDPQYIPPDSHEQMRDQIISLVKKDLDSFNIKYDENDIEGVAKTLVHISQPPEMKEKRTVTRPTSNPGLTTTSQENPFLELSNFIDSENIKFDKINMVECSTFMRRFTTEAIGKKDLSDLRGIIQKYSEMSAVEFFQTLKESKERFDFKQYVKEMNSTQQKVLSDLEKKYNKNQLSSEDYNDLNNAGIIKIFEDRKNTKSKNRVIAFPPTEMVCRWILNNNKLPEESLTDRIENIMYVSLCLKVNAKEMFNQMMGSPSNKKTCTVYSWSSDDDDIAKKYGLAGLFDKEFKLKGE